MSNLNPRKPKAIINVPVGAPFYQGSSGIAKTLGFSDFGTPREAYHQFIGDAPAPSEEQQEIFDRGHRAEGFIAKEIEAVYGYKLRKVNGAYVHPNYDWWICHPDRMMVGKVDGKRIGVEIKSSSAYVNDRWGKEDTDDIPLDYFFQCLSYMACGVCDEVHLFRCSNWKLTRYIVRYDEEKIQKVESVLPKVIEKFIARIEPEPSTWKEVTETYTDPKEDIVAYGLLKEYVTKYDEAKAREKAASEEAEELKTKIVTIMDGKKRIVDEKGKALHTYSVNDRTSLDTKSLKAEMPEVYAKYSNTKPVPTFR